MNDNVNCIYLNTFTVNLDDNICLASLEYYIS